MGFLLVDHTHEDIVQIFSLISGELKSRDVLTMEYMLAQIGKKIGEGKKRIRSTWCFIGSPRLEEGHCQI